MFRKHFSLILFLTYSFVGLGLLSWSADTVVRSLRYTLHYIVAPWSDPPLAAMDRLGSVGKSLARLIDLDKTYRSLESRGLIVEVDQLRVQSVEAENSRLTGLLGMDAIPHFTPLAARVWSRELVSGFQCLIIRRGAVDGVRQADPLVIMENGRVVFLGQIAEVFPKTSRVILLTDPASAVSSVVLRTGEQGVAEGMSPSRLILNYLYFDTEVRAGDEVVTAGLGGIVPPGLLVGTVVSLETVGVESFRRALVRPAAHLGRVTDVLVLLPSDRITEDRP
jgi:rod shape-determining protein MreC